MPKKQSSVLQKRWYFQNAVKSIKSKQKMPTNQSRVLQIFRQTKTLYTKLPLWIRRAHNFHGVQPTNFERLHEITEAMGFMRSLFHYNKQITPLEKVDHKVSMDYKQQISKFNCNHWGNGFYEVPFPLLHKSPPWKSGNTQLAWNTTT